MSERLTTIQVNPDVVNPDLVNPDLSTVNAEQAAHASEFTITDNRASTKAGIGVDFNGNVTFPAEAPAAAPSFNVVDKRRVAKNGTLTPYGAASVKANSVEATPVESTPVEAKPAESAPEVVAAAPSTPETAAEALHPDRALVRWGKRLDRLAKHLTGTADRRTATQVVSEKAEAAKASAKQVATKVGVAAIMSVDSALEGGIRVSNYASEKKSSVKEFITEKRDAAQARKEARVNAAAERAEDRKLDQAYRMNEKFDADTERAAIRKEDQAYRMNKKFDAKIRRAETREELTEKAKATAKFAGKAALVTGVLAGYGAYKAAEAGTKLDVKTAELATKGVRKSIEVATEVSEATKVKVTRGKQAIKETAAKTKLKAEARLASAVLTYHDNQMRKHTRKASKHQAKSVSPYPQSK